MNKEKSQFAHLPAEDRQHILELCSRQSYDFAVEALKKPRPEGGLGIVTSRSALCRFFTTAQLEAAPELLAQRAAVAQIRYEQRSNTFLAAIRAEIEARVLENLYNGKALADIEKDLRLLKNAQSLYLADANYRARCPKEARAAYQAHVDLCAQAPEVDFVPLDATQTTPSPEPDTVIVEPSAFEQEVAKARLKQKRADEQRLEILAKLAAAGIGPFAEPAKQEPVPAPEPPKTPVIPHIPPNSTSTAAPAQPSPASPEPDEAKRVPFVRPDPKINRNAPCPCGSGKKHKRCCLGKS